MRLSAKLQAKIRMWFVSRWALFNIPVILTMLQANAGPSRARFLHDSFHDVYGLHPDRDEENDVQSD
jgi:hypothetical protein